MGQPSATDVTATTQTPTGEVIEATPVTWNDALQAIIPAIIDGSYGIYDAPEVAQQPDSTLINWSIKYTKAGCFFVGCCLQSGYEGRVSTNIEQFDATTMTGVTKSGRVYHLEGPAGDDPGGNYVWGFCVDGWRGPHDPMIGNEYSVDALVKILADKAALAAIPATTATTTETPTTP